MSAAATSSQACASIAAACACEHPRRSALRGDARDVVQTTDVERLIVIIEITKNSTEEIDELFEQQGWKRMAPGHWEAVFLSQGAADKQTTRTLEAAYERFGDLGFLMRTRRAALGDPVPRGL